MRLTDIALRNLQVRKAKVLFLIFGIVLGVAIVVILANFTAAMRAEADQRQAEQGSRILITPKTQRLSLAYRGVTVASGMTYQKELLSGGLLEELKNLPSSVNINTIAPKLLGQVEMDGGKFLVVGSDLKAEKTIYSYLRPQGNWPQTEDQVLAGALAARQMGKAPGSILAIGGKEFILAGVLEETGGPEDRFVFMDLGQAQAILGQHGSLTLVELLVNKPAGGELLDEIKNKLPHVEAALVQTEADARQEVVQRFSRFSLLVMLVVVVIGSLIIGTSMMASVNERAREIGVFRALGFRQKHIMGIILTEAFVVSGLGGIIGCLAGLGFSLALQRALQVDGAVGWNPGAVLGALVLSVAVGLAASLYPAWRAARLDPAEALRLI
ncbi:MAG: ABC transporter permease [Bacillota bacterium]